MIFTSIWHEPRRVPQHPLLSCHSFHVTLAKCCDRRAVPSPQPPGDTSPLTLPRAVVLSHSGRHIFFQCFLVFFTHAATNPGNKCLQRGGTYPHIRCWKRVRVFANTLVTHTWHKENSICKICQRVMLREFRCQRERAGYEDRPPWTLRLSVYMCVCGAWRRPVVVARWLLHPAYRPTGFDLTISYPSNSLTQVSWRSVTPVHYSCTMWATPLLRGVHVILWRVAGPKLSYSIAPTTSFPWNITASFTSTCEKSALQCLTV